MIKISLFKTAKHKQFSYQPRHYDPDKEEFEQRVAAAKAQAGVNEEGNTVEGRMRGAIRRQSRQTRKGADFSQLIFMAGMMVTLAVYWFYGNWALLCLVLLIYGYIKLKQRQG
ncbi:MAG: hypothetical protein MUC97_03935 [Bernardetiaceae bacterium]|jgi:hypothetical protein|nr:hypothetical protein [Bernardetiaceae bacterium]